MIQLNQSYWTKVVCVITHWMKKETVNVIWVTTEHSSIIDWICTQHKGIVLDLDFYSDFWEQCWSPAWKNSKTNLQFKLVDPKATCVCLCVFVCFESAQIDLGILWWNFSWKALFENEFVAFCAHRSSEWCAYTLSTKCSWFEITAAAATTTLCLNRLHLCIDTVCFDFKVFGKIFECCMTDAKQFDSPFAGHFCVFTVCVCGFSAYYYRKLKLEFLSSIHLNRFYLWPIEASIETRYVVFFSLNICFFFFWNWYLNCHTFNELNHWYFLHYSDSFRSQLLSLHKFKSG